MIAFLAVWRRLSTLPRIAYVIALAALLIVGGLWFAYRAGDTHGQTAAHRHALADSIDKEVIVHHLAIEQTDRVRGAAHTAHRFADASRPQRDKLRDSVEAMLNDLPQPVVSLIHLDDQQIRRDSVALVAYLAVDSAVVSERIVASELDASRQHQAEIGVPPKTHHRLAFVAGVVVAVAGAVLVHTVVR